MLQKLKSLFTTAQARNEASIFSKLEIPYFNLSSYESYIENLTRRLPLAAACISLRARKVRTTRWRIVDSRGQEVRGRQLGVLNRPNSFQSFEDILELMVWHLDSVGNAYALRLGDKNTFQAMYLLNPLRIQPYHIEEMFITKYDYRPLGSESMTFQPFEVVHLKYPNPKISCFGLGLVEQAEILLQKNLNRDSYSESYYKNGALMSGVFTSDSASLSTKQQEQMQVSFRSVFSGVSNFFKVFFAWGGFKFTPISNNNRDSQDVEQSKHTHDVILAVFGVPGALLGFTDGVNFSNAEIQERIFINNTLIPLLERLEQLVTREIIHQINPDWKFEFIKPAHENLTLKSVWVSRCYQDGVISKEQYGKLMGVEADGVGKVQGVNISQS
jgi:HK97 family phage portal protein